MILLENPAQIRLVGYAKSRLDELKKKYSYTDKAILYEIQRLKNAYWFINKYGEEAWRERLAELESAKIKCLVEQDGQDLLTYSGFLPEICQTYSDEFKGPYNDFLIEGLPWYSEPLFVPYKYQEEALKRFLNSGPTHHGCISLPMGSGKSFLLLLLAKTIGLKTVLLVPSVAIGNQLFELFVKHLGSKYVGMYGDNKKQINKLITIALGQSLAKIQPNTPAWEHFSTCKVLESDEGHVTASDTFAQVCTNLLKNIPYRFFTTATPFRNGPDSLLLDGIMGPILMEYSFQEFVDMGYIAKPTFIIRKIQSNRNFESRDVLKMIEKHWYSNSALHEDAAKLANQLVSELNHKVMIMIDHVSQFPLIYNHLRHNFDFAHGPLNKDNKKYVPPEYQNKKIPSIIKDFNEGNLPILIGTGAISVGVDTKPVNTIINLQAGASEVKFTQLVGRGDRVTPTKKVYNFVDYMVENVPVLKGHTLKRIKMYKKLYPNVIYYD